MRRKRRVVCRESGESWASTYDAAHDIGVTRSAASKALRNGYRCRGRILEYEDGPPRTNSGYTRRMPYKGLTPDATPDEIRDAVSVLRASKAPKSVATRPECESGPLNAWDVRDHMARERRIGQIRTA